MDQNFGTFVATNPAMYYIFPYQFNIIQYGYLFTRRHRDNYHDSDDLSACKQPFCKTFLHEINWLPCGFNQFHHQSFKNCSFLASIVLTFGHENLLVGFQKTHSLVLSTQFEVESAFSGLMNAARLR